MASDYDATDFVDGDLVSRRSAGPASAARAPSREEVDVKVAEAQQKLAELKRAQEELERERAALEETRRRQIELQTARQEMIHNLTRGLELLQEAEFSARRDAEQMAKALVDLREALGKIQGIQEESWNKENFSVELTRALTVLENARMEWNSARLKFTILNGELKSATEGLPPGGEQLTPLFGQYTFSDLCRLGFALTWPLFVIAFLALAALIVFLVRHG